MKLFIRIFLLLVLCCQIVCLFGASPVYFLPNAGAKDVIKPQPTILHGKYFGTLNGFPSDRITAIAHDSKGNIFVGTADKGVVFIDSGYYSWFSLPHEPEASGPQAIHSLLIDETQDKRLWIGAADGLYYTSLSKLNPESKISQETNFDGGAVLSLAQIPGNSSLWIASGKGLYERNPKITRFSEKDGLCSNMVQTLEADKKSGIWVGTAAGLMQKVGTTFHEVENLSPNSENTAWVYDLQFLEIKDSVFFKEQVPTIFDGLLKGLYDRKTEDQENEKAKKFLIEVVDASIQSLKRKTPGQTLYAATNQGAFEVNKSERSGEKLAKGWFTALAGDSNGNVCGANKDHEVFPVDKNPGLMQRFDLGRRIRRKLKGLIFAEVNNDDPKAVRSQIDEKTLEMLRGMNEEELDKWVEKKILANPVSAMSFDQKGNLWVGFQNGGLVRYTPLNVNGTNVAHGILKCEEPEITKSKGLIISTLKVDFPHTDDILVPLLDVEQLLHRKDFLMENYWIGRWSQLEEKDMIKVARFIGEWTPGESVEEFAESVPYDPYVIIPLDLNGIEKEKKKAAGSSE
jgi:ligand-binding sensor domain-containing protein